MRKDPKATIVPDDESQKPLVQVMDANGKWFYAPIPTIEHVAIPDGWYRLSWFIVSTISKPQPPSLPRLDQLVAVEIVAQGFPVVMPVAIRKVRERLPNGKSGKGMVDMPKLICAGYVLVGMADNDLENIKSVMRIINTCRHVGGFVSQGDRPVRLTKFSVKRLFDGLNKGLYAESVVKTDVAGAPILGGIVEIINGPMELLRGPVKKFVSKKSGDNAICTHAFVDVDIFGRVTPVKIPIDSLRRVD